MEAAARSCAVDMRQRPGIGNWAYALQLGAVARDRDLGLSTCKHCLDAVARGRDLGLK